MSQWIRWILIYSILIVCNYFTFVTPFLGTTSLRSNIADHNLQRKSVILPASKSEIMSDTINLQPIGTVSSIYRLCVGTPRQGLLSPNSRGRIDLYPSRISSDSISDLENFSHLWIVFIFHLNSNTKVLEDSKLKQRQFPAKIAPPALGGKRVGIFATRSPHRPNPIGFTLCKIDRVVIPNHKEKSNSSREKPFQIYISGIDLVDGTPVLDIKPYVPHYDSIGFMKGSNTPSYEDSSTPDLVRVPPWVNDGLEKRRKVWFSSLAYDQLQQIMMDESKPLDFYGVHSGRDENVVQALESVKKCISEVLAVDVRSRFQTNKAREGKFKAEKTNRVKSMSSNDIEASGERMNDSTLMLDPDPICTQQIDRLLVKYIVRQHTHQGMESSIDTDGSGADDDIDIVAIEYVSR